MGIKVQRIYETHMGLFLMRGSNFNELNVMTVNDTTKDVAKGP